MLFTGEEGTLKLKDFLGHALKGSLLVQVSCSRFDKGHMRAWTSRPRIYLASLAAVPFLMFRSFCCTTNKPPILRLLLWGKSTRSNQWLWSPRSFLLQDFLCVRIVARHTVANMIPPHHCTIEYSGVTNLDIYHWWIYNSYKIGPGKTVESHKEMLLCSGALPSFSGDRLGVKNQRIIDCQWTQARTRALTEWKEWWLLKSLYPPGIYQIDSKNGQI